MRTVTIELPKALAERYRKYADENGRLEGQSIFALVLQHAYNYRAFKRELATLEKEMAKADGGEHAERLSLEQLSIEQVERENAIMEQNRDIELKRSQDAIRAEQDDLQKPKEGREWID